MEHAKTNELGEVSEGLRRAAAGDEEALRGLFDLYRDRLERMVHLRLSRRLAEGSMIRTWFRKRSWMSRKLPEYVQEPRLPLFLWMRHLTALKLTEVYRRHLGTQLRDADREETLHRGGLPLADSVSLAAQTFGDADDSFASRDQG
jgi:RNA polymerase sigma-70 factor, ECF subfamily